MLLDSVAGKGLEVSGNWSLRGGSVLFDLTLTNKALITMQDFAVMFNKNR